MTSMVKRGLGTVGAQQIFHGLHIGDGLARNNSMAQNLVTYGSNKLVRIGGGARFRYIEARPGQLREGNIEVAAVVSSARLRFFHVLRSRPTTSESPGTEGRRARVFAYPPFSLGQVTACQRTSLAITTLGAVVPLSCFGEDPAQALRSDTHRVEIIGAHGLSMTKQRSPASAAHRVGPSGQRRRKKRSGCRGRARPKSTHSALRAGA